MECHGVARGGSEGKNVVGFVAACEAVGDAVNIHGDAGITSWGQVKYGYAENVDEMVERLRYDLPYLENMSLTTDLLMYWDLLINGG
jgi:lipopolysaccharide/colanic/teichoic acid biosynthesis glycosyltransferase